MVEVAEDNKKKRKKGKKGGDVKKEEKSHNVGIEPMTSYSALSLNHMPIRV